MFYNTFTKYLLIIILCLPIIASAQLEKKFYFENISIPDGLSNTQVWDIQQDKYGFLWIATQDGLNRYDGYNFKIYKNDPDDINSLPNNQVQTISIDKDGNFLLGTLSGLAIFDRVSESFKHIYIDSSDITLPSNNVISIFKDSQSRIWIGTGRGIYQFDITKKRFSLAKIKNKEKTMPTDGIVFSFMETSAKEIYAGYLFHGLIKYNEELNLFERIGGELENQNPLKGNLIFNNFEDKTGKL